MKLHKKLAIFLCSICLILSGCSSEKNVTDFETTITIGETSVTGTYTGVVKSSKAQGEGSFQSTEDGWTYTGMFEDGVLTGTGTMTNLPLTITLQSQDYEGLYTGDALNGIAEGTGIFTGADATPAALSFQGDFKSGSVGAQGEVKNLPAVVTYFEKEYTGIYNGQLADGNIDGTGEFHSDNQEEYLNYDGEWANGEISGTGSLSASHMVLDMVTVARTGSYEGEVKDGFPHGQGIFTVNPEFNPEGDDTAYTYDGEWSEGVKHGSATQVYSNIQMTFSGTYTNGDFTPSILDFYTSYGSQEYSNFTIQPKAAEVLTQSPHLFPAASIDEIAPLIDEALEVRHISKNPANYGDRIMKFPNMTVVQIYEYEDIWGYPLTEIILRDSEYNAVCTLILKPLDNVYEGDTITLYGLPLNSYTYLNVEKTQIHSIMIAGCIVE